MRKRALLAVFVALPMVGAYGAYVISYPRYPEVKGCVNPFAVTKSVGRVQEKLVRASYLL
ncbi:hypothetical protein [Thermococcus sp. Bubb.Bath]|uniref:hypothetical protein n=1 Tax=Thermococcus sp. Bubb.Bath TaxID=1638242 RepID=UPI00143C13B1|nr:hypothetical protein [Thermococcus sp. Bubb.Bath]NJF24557.1 hypothetical protein [Thermococcus sp. Bubb.Bath]